MRLRETSLRIVSKTRDWFGQTSASMWTHFRVCFVLSQTILFQYTYFLVLGNEEDIIILSLVRSSDLGFLRDERRTNVMLTRCKEALYICSSWKFLIEGPGNQCLVGRMAAHMGPDAWLTVEDIESDNF